jgi:hypothetical protein
LNLILLSLSLSRCIYRSESLCSVYEWNYFCHLKCKMKNCP